MHTRHPFHDHTGQLPTKAPAIIQNLVADWARLHGCPTASRTVCGWANHIGPLAEATTVGHIIDTLTAADTQTVDDIIASLLGRYQDGDQLAGRVLLQAMLPALNRLARRARMPDHIDTIEARHQYTISTFWLILVTTRAKRKLASRLQLDTLHKITDHRRDAADTWEHHTDHTPGGDGDVGHIDSGRDPADIDLEDLLAWARRHQILSLGDVQILADVYLTDPKRTNYQMAAHKADITMSACRKRVQRARQRLATAVTSNTQEQPSSTPRAA